MRVFGLTLVLSMLFGSLPSLATAAPPLQTTPIPLHITEIMYNPPAQGGMDGRDLEFVELYNGGATPLDLGAFRFSSGIEYSFPADATLAPGIRLVLASSTNGFLTKYGEAPFGEYEGQLDNGGETLRLENRAGEIVLSQAYSDGASWPCGPDGGDFSLVLSDPTTPNAGASWRISSAAGGSPGLEDPPPAPAVPPLVINEILAHTDAPEEDAVELANPTARDAHVGGWYLGDDRLAPQRYQLPEGLYVPAGGYLVLTESQFGAGDDGFGLSEGGETVVLTAATCSGESLGYRQQQPFGASPNGVTSGRYVISTGVVRFPLLAQNTLGAGNASPQVGPLVISRIMYHPGAESTIQDEYIEVRNISAENVPLYLPATPWLTWRLRGAVRFDFPSDVSLEADARMLVVSDSPADFRLRYNIAPDVLIFGPYDGALDNSGERLSLLMPGALELTGPQHYYEMDAVEYGNEAPWPPAADGQGPALARADLSAYGDDPANWRADGAQTLKLFLPFIAAHR